MSYNLIDEEWIPVLRSDGRPDRLGILEALSEAGKIRQIAASNPMDLFAIHRFLLTLLYWKADEAGGVEALSQTLLKGAVPSGIKRALDAEASQFDLVDAKRPFLQDVTALEENRKSAGSFFAEMACGTNVAHFHHGDDDLRLCLACAASGLLRLVPWTQSGGQGLTPAVHGAPPIMALAYGRNLAETLGLNLVPLDGRVGVARWSGHFKPSSPAKPIPYLEALTWNPRRVHLGEVQKYGACWRCGSRGVKVVGPIVYAKNEETKSNKQGAKTVPFIWQDPSAFYGSDAPYVTIKSYNEQLAAEGRDMNALLKKAKNGSQPTSMVHQSNQAHKRWLLVVPCTNPANNKTYDHRLIELPSLSSDAISAILPPKPKPWRQQEMDGWASQSVGCPGKGSIAFVETASRLLTHGDWAVLASAAYRSMHQSAAAFNLFAGLLWSLRERVPDPPSRNSAWLVVKLMAAVPADVRIPRRDAKFCPLNALPKRQLGKSRGTCSPYPISLPAGLRLEAALRGAIDRKLRSRTPHGIDWAGLCHRLNIMPD